MNRGNILDKAKELINGERQDSYGNPEDCFNDIATLWSWYLDKLIIKEDVAIMMALLKVSREKANHKSDNIADACGYLALYKDFRNELISKG